MARRKQMCGIAHVLLLSLAASCKSPTSPPETPVPSPSAVIDGATVTLDAYVYRNLQPSPRPDRSLIVVLRLHTTAASVRNGLKVQSVALTLTSSGDHWVSSSLEPGAPPDPGADYVELVARGGPDWPVGSSCTVTVSVVSASGTTAMLGNAGAVIQSVS